MESYTYSTCRASFDNFDAQNWWETINIKKYFSFQALKIFWGFVVSVPGWRMVTLSTRQQQMAMTCLHWSEAADTRLFSCRSQERLWRSLSNDRQLIVLTQEEVGRHRYWWEWRPQTTSLQTVWADCS